MVHSDYTRTVPGASCAVLMIHGIIGTPRHFDPLLPFVPADWDIRSILLDGHGGSPRDFSKSSMAKWKVQVEQELDALCRIHKNVVILGHSMGTLLAMEAAPKQPKVKGLFLLNVPLCPRVKPSSIPRTIRLCLGFPPKDRWEQAVMDDAGIEMTWKLWQYVGLIPRYVELLILCKQARGWIPHITLPCHVFQSAKDELVSPRASRFFAGHPVVRHQVLTHSGHFAYFDEDLETLGQSLSVFLKEIGI